MLIICAFVGVIININNISVFSALHGSAQLGHYQVLYGNTQIQLNDIILHPLSNCIIFILYETDDGPLRPKHVAHENKK
jgi:hypothetical protein